MKAAGRNPGTHATPDSAIAASGLRLYLDFASPISGLGGKMGMDATCNWPGETEREWGRLIVMDDEVKKRVDDMWDELGLI